MIYNNRDLEFIVKYRRFKLTFLDLYKLVFLYFGLICIVYIVFNFIETPTLKIAFYIFSLLFVFAFACYFSFLLFKRVSFITYVNELDKEMNFNITIQVLNKFSLKPITINKDIIYANYDINSIISKMRLFKLKQEVYIIPTNNSLLINFRSNDPALLINPKSDLNNKIIEELTKQMRQKKIEI
jgi:hypothetical protein